MRIEVLYPELCSLYGEMANLRYLQQSLPQAEIVQTHLGDTPACLLGKAELVYLGAMTERGQALALEQMRRHREEYRHMIDGGTVVLATGNAMELFGTSIDELSGLELLDFSAVRDMEHRHNSMFLGKFGEMEIVGAKSQFSHTKSPVEPALFEVIGGFGTDLKSKQEGIHIQNFFGTYLLGPLLPLNPLFTQHLMGLLGSAEKPAFFEAAMQACHHRIQELKQPGVNFSVGEHG